ncbi:MAG: YbhB/YbcL family Raf kinase inhibitor-like protein [Parcubacteria group bacterium]|nr:YbhB/YbcL family Raf kinase inhibitor-like protein [Parcubacteria group bacterium]
MEIKSSAFEHEALMSSKYACDGKGMNPPLSWSGVPKETKTLALTVDDPDAPGGLFVHWILWNISPKLKGISEGKVPEDAVQGKNDFGKREYGGVCPPRDEHRYYFKLYALDTELNISEMSDKESLEEEMLGHVLERAELVGRYAR